MRLRDFDFKPTYRTDIDDIGNDFLSEALSRADSYDRAAGYFRSSSIRALSRGLGALIAREGQMRLIVSAELTNEDIASISSGYVERASLIEQSLSATVDELELEFQAFPTQALTWLIARNSLDIQVAIPEDLEDGIYHEKIGVIRDDSYTVAFSGSLNETEAALKRNFESIDVYCSWREPARVAAKELAFEQLWDNKTARVTVSTFPAALRERLLKIAPKSAPTEHHPDLAAPNAFGEKSVLRPYQETAVARWIANGSRGVFEMATGTGKTITAIEAIQRSIAQGLKLFVVVAPLKHLMDQWEHEIRRFLNVDVIRCFSNAPWRNSLPLLVQGLQLADDTRPLVVLTIYDTAESTDFREAISRAKVSSMFVADEMHNITAERADRLFSPQYSARLGLSATVERYLDPIGTQKALDWFGGIVFAYGLAEAIQNRDLTPYDYFPIFCKLTDAEDAAYFEIQIELDDMEGDTSKRSKERRRKLNLLHEKRASILESAQDKLVKFEEVIREGSFGDEGHNLVYVHPEYLDIVQLIIGREMHLTSRRFTFRESIKERKELLAAFASNVYSFLIAIRCLDEGVDIPSTRTAFLLNSSANPKQFVQRRGRVLRKYSGKAVARIYDFVVLPQRMSSAREEALWEREMARFRQFADLARNRQTSLLKLDSAMRRFRSEIY